MNISISVDGKEKLARELQGLAKDLKADIQRKASVDSVRGLAKAIRNFAPRDTGNLERSIIGRSAKRSRSISTDKNAFIFANVVATRTKGKDGGYYLHLVRDGHRLVTRNKNPFRRKVLRFIPGHDFVQQGVEREGGKVEQDFFESVRKRVEKFNRGA